MTSFINRMAAHYVDAKRAFGDLTGANEDLLHVHAGLLILVVSAALLRKKMRSPIPLVLVVFFALANEWVDWLSGRPGQPLEPFIDIANTVFWPAILFFLIRRRG